MADDTPIAWLALAPGTPILASDGSEVGKVDDVIADREKDIFSGLTFRPGWLDARLFIPADRVSSMTESAVRLDITAEEAKRLEPYAS